LRQKYPVSRQALVASGIEDTTTGDDVETFVLGVGVRDGAAAAAAVHDLVEEGEGVVGLDAGGHDAPEVVDLPVGGRVLGMGDEGFGDGGHGGGT